MSAELIGYTSAEAATKAEAGRILDAGKQATKPLGGAAAVWWQRIQETLTDTSTGQFDITKLAIIGGVGVLGLSLGGIGGPLLMAAGGVAGILAAYLGVSLFGTQPKTATIVTPTLPKPVGLTPTPGFVRAQTVEVPKAPSRPLTASIPVTDESKNPMPAHDLREVERLRRNAESETPHNNPDNQKLRDMMRQLQLTADQWEVNLRSTRRHFAEYKAKVHPYLEAAFRDKYRADTWSCSLSYLIPDAPLHPTVYKDRDALSQELEHYGERVMGLTLYGRELSQLSRDEQIRASNEWNNKPSGYNGPVERDIVEKRNIVYNYAKEKARQYEVKLQEALNKLNSAPLHAIGKQLGLIEEDYKEMPFRFMVRDDRSRWQSVNPFDSSVYQQMLDALQGAYQLYKKDARAGLEKIAVIFQAHRDLIKDDYKEFVEAAIEGGKAYGTLRRFDEYLERHLYPNIEKLKRFAKEELPEYNRHVQLFKDKMKTLERIGLLVIGESVSDSKDKQVQRTLYLYDARKSHEQQVTITSRFQSGERAGDMFDVYLGSRHEPFTIKLAAKDDTLMRSAASVDEKARVALTLVDRAERMLQEERKAATIHILRTELIEPSGYERQRKEWHAKEQELVASGKKFSEASAIVEKDKEVYIKKNPLHYVTYIRDGRDPHDTHNVEIRITHDTPSGYGSREYDVRFDMKGAWIRVTLPQADYGLETSGTEYKQKAARVIIDKARELQDGKRSSKAPAGERKAPGASMFESLLAGILPDWTTAAAPTIHQVETLGTGNVPFRAANEGSMGRTG